MGAGQAHRCVRVHARSKEAPSRLRPRTGGRHDGAVAAVLAVSRRRPSEVLRAPRRAPAHTSRRGGATTAPPLPALAPSEGSAGDAASHSSSAGLRHALQNSYEMPKGLTVLLQLWILDLQDGHRSPRHQFCSSAHRSSLNSSLRLRSIPFSTFIDRSEETGRAAAERSRGAPASLGQLVGDHGAPLARGPSPLAHGSVPARHRRRQRGLS